MTRRFADSGAGIDAAMRCDLCHEFKMPRAGSKRPKVSGTFTGRGFHCADCAPLQLTPSEAFALAMAENGGVTEQQMVDANVCACDTAGRSLNRLVSIGKLFISRPDITKARTFFPTREAADAHYAANGRHMLPPSRINPKRALKGAKWDADAAPVNQVQVQVCPGFTGDRYAVTEPVRNGFASLGVGRYLETA